MVDLSLLLASHMAGDLKSLFFLSDVLPELRFGLFCVLVSSPAAMQKPSRTPSRTTPSGTEMTCTCLFPQRNYAETHLDSATEERDTCPLNPSPGLAPRACGFTWGQSWGGGVRVKGQGDFLLF